MSQIVTVVIGVFAIFGVFAVVLWQVGASLTLLGGFLASVITLVGVLLTHSINRRTVDLKEQAENRLRLEAGIRALALLSTESGAQVPEIQRAGSLFSLVTLGFPPIALAILAQMLAVNQIDGKTAAWVVGHVLEGDDDDLKLEAANTLFDYADKLAPVSHSYAFPKVAELRWSTDLPELVREYIALARLKMIRSKGRRDWNEGDINSHIASLTAIWRSESNARIKTDAGLFLKKLVALHYPTTTIFPPSGPIKISDVVTELSKLDNSMKASALAQTFLEGIDEWLDIRPNMNDEGEDTERNSKIKE